NLVDAIMANRASTDDLVAVGGCGHVRSTPGSCGNVVNSRSELTTLLGGVKDGADDLVVAGAAAQVAGQPVPYLFLARLGVLLQQCLGGDDEAWRANATLQSRVLEELLLERVQPLRRRDALDRGHRFALYLGAEDEAGVDEPAFEDDIARAAVTIVAAFLAAG